MNQPDIRAIAFDWGGIFTEGTFDSSATRNLAKLYGVSEERVAATYYPLMARFEVGDFGFDEFYREFGSRSGLEADAQAFRDTFLGSIKERELMFELLAAIPESYTVGILSNNVPVLCDKVRNDSRMKRIEHFVFSNEIKVRKPDPAAFAALSEALELPPANTVFIDDSKDNIAACRELGYQGLLLESIESFVADWQTLLPDIPVPAVS